MQVIFFLCMQCIAVYNKCLISDIGRSVFNIIYYAVGLLFPCKSEKHLCLCKDTSKSLDLTYITHDIMIDIGSRPIYSEKWIDRSYRNVFYFSVRKLLV